MIEPAYTFRPMTRSVMLIDRLAKESGHSAAAILAHIGQCRSRNTLLSICRDLMFHAWRSFDAATGKCVDVEDDVYRDNWIGFSRALLDGVESRKPCPNCKLPCLLGMSDYAMRTID